MTFTQAINSGFKRYWDFKGRSSRSEYWYFYLFAIIAGNVVSILSFLVTYVMPTIIATALKTPVPVSRMMNWNLLLTSLWGLFFFIPNLCMIIRRLHDTNRSGWMMFIPLTIIGIPFYIYWLVKKSDKGTNDFGASPLSMSDFIKPSL